MLVVVIKEQHWAIFKRIGYIHFKKRKKPKTNFNDFYMEKGMEFAFKKAKIELKKR